MDRYCIYKFCLDNTIVVDTKEKTFTFYKTNLYRQFYNLENAEVKKVSAAKINGLIKRLNNNYSLRNSLAVDKFIYEYLMTEEQKEKCNREPSSVSDNNFMCSGNELNKCLYEMCIKKYKQDDRNNTEAFAEKTEHELLSYCNYLIA